MRRAIALAVISKEARSRGTVGIAEAFVAEGGASKAHSVAVIDSIADIEIEEHAACAVTVGTFSITSAVRR